MWFLAFSFLSGRYLKPLPPHLSLSRVLVGLFSQPLPLFPCSPGFLAPTFGTALTVGGCILRREEALVTT